MSTDFFSCVGGEKRKVYRFEGKEITYEELFEKQPALNPWHTTSVEEKDYVMKDWHQVMFENHSSLV